MKSVFSFLWGGENKRGKPRKPAGALRSYIDETLPHDYVNSQKYAVTIARNRGGYSAHIILDMLADGSDYTHFQTEDYLQLSELESGYLFHRSLSSPPVPTSFILEMLFDRENTAIVEKPMGQRRGILTYQGRRREVSF